LGEGGVETIVIPPELVHLQMFNPNWEGCVEKV